MYWDYNGDFNQDYSLKQDAINAAYDTAHYDSSEASEVVLTYYLMNIDDEVVVISEEDFKIESNRRM